MNKALLLIVFLISGCVPFVGYTHMDETPFHNDDRAYDLVCGGGKFREAGNPVEVKIAGCHNVRGGNMFRVDVDYVWSK